VETSNLTDTSLNLPRSEAGQLRWYRNGYGLDVWGSIPGWGNICRYTSASTPTQSGRGNALDEYFGDTWFYSQTAFY
jgi:hypothetical protein